MDSAVDVQPLTRKAIPSERRNMIDCHPSRSAAVSIVLEDLPTPPDAVPVVIVDLGFGIANPGRNQVVVDSMLRRGMTRVSTLTGEVYPGLKDWFYRFTFSSDPAGSRFQVLADNETTVWNGLFFTHPLWLGVEDETRAIVLAIGNFGLIEQRPLEPGFFQERAQQAIKAALTEGFVAGATIARYLPSRD